MTTWNPSDASATITLSNANLTAKATTATDAAVRSTTAKNSGKVYFEVAWATSTGGDTGSGISTPSAPLGGSTGAGCALVYNSGNIWINGVSTGVGLGAVGSTTVCFAVDLVNLRFWARLNGGNWNASAGNNPATNTGGLDISSLFPANYACAVASFQSATPTATLNLGTSAFAFTVPSGFSAWDSVASPATLLDLGGIGREALVSSAGELQLGGVARETLLVPLTSVTLSGEVSEVLLTSPGTVSLSGVVSEVLLVSPTTGLFAGTVREALFAPSGVSARVAGTVREVLFVQGPPLVLGGQTAVTIVTG